VALRMIYNIVQDDIMDELECAWGNMVRVLASAKEDLADLENIVNENIKMCFIIQITTDVWYLRCAEHKLGVIDGRGMRSCLAVRCQLLFWVTAGVVQSFDQQWNHNLTMLQARTSETKTGGYDGPRK
jgi:hypothetical protein